MISKISRLISSGAVISVKVFTDCRMTPEVGFQYTGDKPEVLELIKELQQSNEDETMEIVSQVLIVAKRYL